jgi:hypothetical protein
MTLGVVPSRMLVSAWLPYSDSLTPEKTVAEMKTAGISTAVIMCNDFSTARGPTGFKTFDVAKLGAMASACRASKIPVWLCSWLMPHDIFVDGAIRQMAALRDATEAELIMWDAEEPWTEATGTFNRARSSARLQAAFGSANMGVTAIGSAPLEVQPLAEVCSVWVPQAYATLTTIAKGQARPSEVVPYSLRWWRERYGEPSAGWVIGLAGYDQADEPATTMQPPILDVRVAAMPKVCYWTSNSVAARPEVAEFVADLTRGVVPAPSGHPGIMPTVDIAAMPSPVRVQVVAEIQGLLMAWGISPGQLDGKPGAKTLAAVMEFQRSKLLAPTGIVDALTWAELLRP